MSGRIDPAEWASSREGTANLSLVSGQRSVSGVSTVSRVEHLEKAILVNEVGKGDDELYTVDEYTRLENEIATTKWLVPKADVDEGTLRQHFDPDKISVSVVPSPLRPIRGFLTMGKMVGAFPASVGERYIHYLFDFCEVRTWCVLLAILIWLAAGSALLTYCLLDSTTLSVYSLTQQKTFVTSLVLTGTDQALLLSIPLVALFFYFLFLGLSWTRIDRLSAICENFVTNGYRIGTDASSSMLYSFSVRLLVFLGGQAVMNVHIALVYCDTEVKQILLAVLLLPWQIPLYLATTFCGYIYLQLLLTLTQYFKHLRNDVVYKNAAISKHVSKYEEIVKLGGLPKRLDRLIEQIRHLQVVFGPLLFYEFVLHIWMLVASVYMAISAAITAVKTDTISTAPPWWICGYLLLALHHYLRIAMFGHAGEHLRREVSKALSLVSQFGFVHDDVALLSLTIARKPDKLLTVAGYADLDRTILAKVVFLLLVAIMIAANFKLNDYKTFVSTT